MSQKLFHYTGINQITIVKWKVKAGFVINQIPFLLFTYRENGKNEEQKFKISKPGIIIKKLLRNNGDSVETDDCLFEYELCTHPTLMKDLCAICGVNIDKFDSIEQQKIVENTNVSMVHSIPELRVSKEVAEDLGRADEERLLKYRKLVLLVDLDQTIVHSTNQNIPKEYCQHIFHYQLYGSNSPWYHTKFRPYMTEFLEEISKYYELHICTFGARRYAHHIANLIDPKSKFFPKDRILSRDEFFDPRSKTGNMKSLFPCGDFMVCIIDDRIDVWNYAPNVVQVKPYLCFKTDDINAPEKLNIGFEQETNEKEEKDVATETETKSEDENSTTKNDDEKNSKKNSENLFKEFENLIEDKDDYLLFLKDILIKIHQKYYEEYDEKIKYCCEGEEILIPDLKKIIPSVRRTVLHSVHIVFSGVIATNTNPEFNKYYRLAESLGAIVTNDVILNGSPKTTHLIAARWGTAKVNKCIKYKNIKIVTPAWLLTCADRWEKVDEELFLLTKDSVFNVYNKDNKDVYYDSYNINETSSSSSSKESNSKTMLDLSPLSNFSLNDLNDMGKEVDDACSDSNSTSSNSEDEDDYDDDEEEEEEKESMKVPLKSVSHYLDEDEESLSYAYEGEYPKGWKESDIRGKKRPNSVFDEDDDNDDDDDEKRNEVDLSESSSDPESVGSVDEEIANALEKEFLNS